LVASAWVVLPVFAQERQDAPRPSPPTASKESQRASGVIVKVERLARGVTPPAQAETASNQQSPGPGIVRLTINTNAVWRDWARDQAKMEDRGPASKDAREGANSVATRGEPDDRNSEVVVDVVPDTRVETRFRTPDDETGKGSGTPEGAANGTARSTSAKPVQFRTDDLKPGLFVEADYRKFLAQNPARVVSVIRPIGGPETPPPPGPDQSK